MKSGIEVDELLITQNGLRDIKQVPAMIRFLRTGGMFNEETLGSYAILHKIRIAPLIEIARFDDGVLAIHNGHHRAIAAFLGRQNRRIYSDEFFVRDWKHSDYTDIVLPHWVTPFNVLTQYRIADLKDWKDIVHKYYIEHGTKKTELFIRDNFDKYAEARKFYTVGDMVSKFNYYSLK